MSDSEGTQMYECTRCGELKATEEEIKEHIKENHEYGMPASYKLITTQDSFSTDKTVMNSGARITSKLTRATYGYSSVYYFSDQGIVRINNNYRLFSLGIILVFIVMASVGVGGLVLPGAVFTLCIVPVIYQIFIGYPSQKRLDALPFDQLKLEKGAEFIPWSNISNATIEKTTLKLQFITAEEKRLVLSTDTQDAKQLLSSKFKVQDQK